MNYTVYMHLVPNGKVYIGITRQKPEERWLAGKGYQKQPYFYKAILKYGWENIQHEILFENLSKAEAEQKEVKLIAEYKSNERAFGYNIANGGNVRGRFTEETRNKIRKANTGRHPSDETRMKFRVIQKQRWLDEEYRESQILKRKGTEPWNKGKTTPIETRQKQREAKLNKHIGEKHWKSKKIKNLDTGKIYDSIGLASRDLNIANGTHIVEVCKGKRKTAHGFHWAYL
jgi:group I intron endonuclease